MKDLYTFSKCEGCQHMFKNEDTVVGREERRWEGIATANGIHYTNISMEDGEGRVENVEEFGQRVTRMMEGGYTLQGGVCVENGGYFPRRYAEYFLTFLI